MKRDLGMQHKAIHFKSNHLVKTINSVNNMLLIAVLSLIHHYAVIYVTIPNGHSTIILISLSMNSNATGIS